MNLPGSYIEDRMDSACRRAANKATVDQLKTPIDWDALRQLDPPPAILNANWNELLIELNYGRLDFLSN